MKDFLMTDRLMFYYSNLLTDRQKEILNMYYFEDYSLQEISELLGISRQGVHDSIKKSTRLLSDTELKLGLVDKFIKLEEKIKELDIRLKEIIEADDFKTITIIRDLRLIIDDK